MKAFSIISLTVFAGTAGFIAYSLMKDADRKIYVTTQAETATIEDKLHLSGFVYPSREIEIKPQISGVVDAVFVDIGDSVEEGTPLVSVNLVPNSSEVEQLSNNVKIAGINLSVAERNYGRQKKLLEKKAISKTDFETVEKEYLTAKENYSSAVIQLNLRSKGKKNINNIVRASTSGVVIDIPVKVGTSVVERSSYNAGSTVAVIAGADHFIFKANVPERNIGQLSVGMPVKLKLLAYDTLGVDAVLVKISAKGELTNGAVKFPIEVEFVMKDKSIDLRSGYSATAEFLLSVADNVLTLPEKCINFRGDTSFVYVTDSLKREVSERAVLLGLSDGENVEIKSGIGRNESVITNYHE